MSSLTEIPLGECSLFSSESLVEGTGLGPLVRWSRWHGLPESVSLLGCWPPETGSGRGLVLWVQALLHQLLPPPPRFPALPGLRCGLRQPSQLLWGSWLDQAPRSQPGVPNTDFSPQGVRGNPKPAVPGGQPPSEGGSPGRKPPPSDPLPLLKPFICYLFTAAPANRLSGDVLILHNPIPARSLTPLVLSLVGRPTWTPAQKVLGLLAGGGPAPPADSEYVGWGPALSWVELGCPGGGLPPSLSRVTCLHSMAPLLLCPLLP